MPSWEEASSWYDKLVGEGGHYYHESVILPALSKELQGAISLLDVGCGQGILARHIPSKTAYLGLDASPSLIAAARKKSPGCIFEVADVCKPWKIKKNDFTNAVMLLSFQNMESPKVALQEIRKHLISSGQLIIVLNHPAFRIPRHSSWGVDEKAHIQFRRINHYMSPQKIPIQVQQTTTWSFHYPLSTISQMLFEAGFSIKKIEEWCSDKKSQGAHKAIENRARKEFPLFMTLFCQAEV